MKNEQLKKHFDNAPFACEREATESNDFRDEIQRWEAAAYELLDEDENA